MSTDERRPPVDAVIAHVLACYPVRGRRVVVDGDTAAAPGRVDAMAAVASPGLVVVAARGRAHTEVEPGRWPLAPGGLLVVVLPFPVPVDAVVARARAAGLRYLQHNVAFGVPPTGPNSATAARRARGHARIHIDVLVFQCPGR